MPNSKHAFWQALIVTIAIFVIGIFIGILIEGKRADYAEEKFIESELFLMDSFTLSELAGLSDSSLNCKTLVNSGVNLADKIYYEALSFEDQGESEKLTESIGLVLKRYDLLRTLLWINMMKIPENCREETSVVVYLFERNTQDLTKRSTHQVWEKILFDLKQEFGNEIILIPISVDDDLTSLNTLLSEFNISKYPVVIVDNKHVISELSSVDELKTYLK